MGCGCGGSTAKAVRQPRERDKTTAAKVEARERQGATISPGYYFTGPAATKPVAK